MSAGAQVMCDATVPDIRSVERSRIQQYLTTNAVRPPLEAKPWGFKEFFVCDPFRNLVLFAERISDEEAGAAQEG